MKIIKKKKKNMKSLTEKETEYHDKQTTCYIGKKEFDENKKNYRKVYGHFHYTSKYRGVAHNFCNLRQKIPKEMWTSGTASNSSG